MPLPLVSLLPFAMRLGAVATVYIGIRKIVAARRFPGRTDQRAEDALDDLHEGLAIHKPADRADDRQTNAAARFRRVIHVNGQAVEVDAGFMARFRVRKL